LQLLHGGNANLGDVNSTGLAYLLFQAMTLDTLTREEHMSQFDTPNLTAADIRAIEARAHQLRSEAMRDMMRALGRGIAAVPHKVVSLFHRSHPA